MTEQENISDLDLLLRLLKEHSEKLQVQVDTRLKVRFIASVVLSLGGVIGALSLFYFLPHLLKSTEQSSADLFLALCSSLAPVLISFFLSLQLRERSSRSLFTIRQLRNSLALLIRRASQIEDHGKMDFTRRIALDLQLAEAEAILKFSKSSSGLQFYGGDSENRRESRDDERSN
jgi:hypothetical protein